MAMLDDPDWILQHIRHSFITSDDTGMCEMVLQDNDMMTLEEHKLRIKKLKEERRAERAKSNQKKGLPESFGRSTPVGSPKRAVQRDTESVLSTGTTTTDSIESESGSPIAPSPDIQSGWDFGGRRRSNTAQKLERIRKERQSRVKVNTIAWRKRNLKITEEQLKSMFEKKKLSSRSDGIDGHVAASRDSNIKIDLESPPLIPIESNLKLTDKVPKYIGFDVKNDDDEPDSAASLLINVASSPTPTETSHKASVDSSYSENSVGELFKRKRGMSALAKMLNESTEQYDNPFRDYAKFDGHGQIASGVKKVDIFVWPYGAEKPRFSMLISVLSQKAKVQDVIGLTCWKYSVEDQEPKLSGQSVQRFFLHIADDDGTIDTDFPPLEANEPFSKFSFKYLALVEKRPPQTDEDRLSERGVKETVFVKVNDYEGSSLVQVDDLTIKMGEILMKTLKRRKGQNYTGKYVLEYQDKVGVVVDEEQTLESTGVMEFYLKRENSSRSTVPTNNFDGSVRALTDKLSPMSDDEYQFPPKPKTTAHGASDGFIFIPTMEYTTFRLNQMRKLRSPVPVDFGVGPNQIDVVPIERRETKSAITQLLSPRVKTLTIRIPMIAHCGIHDPKSRTSSLSVTPPSSSGSFSSSFSSMANQDSTTSSKSYEKLIFKLYYKLSEYHNDFKHLTLEGPTEEVHEAIEKVHNVMVLCGNKKLQSAFEAFKFGASQSTTSSSNSTLKRRGSIFR